ncbi:heme oxygenase [Pseudooceanicola nitratireducens]|uniref:Heme oxygenase n=1 Tax=Pseudooceanicola nitratireducens TaxID=517719 RepID=A0A1I1IVQ6_9RHOB|nr:biliverdin-producing heme oxygenase [Pseudooceanicola nitratireducens]SEJ27049.1 heme oxygenase [Pseudooceanicola nitratireducens]SFC40324.1 heme oxygenase [Pseudooceanicola nitratireducens]
MTLPFVPPAGSSTPGFQPVSLRARLRADTRAAHDRLDALLSGADLSHRLGLAQFLHAQKHGFDCLALLSDPADPPQTAPVVTALRASLRADLDFLGLGRGQGDLVAADDQSGAPTKTAKKSSGQRNLLASAAVDYMVLGSGLGAAVLRKRWLRASDPSLHGAGGFLTAERSVDDWKALVTRLDSLPGTGAGADRAVADAARIFGFFSDGWEDFDRTKASEVAQTGIGLR